MTNVLVVSEDVEQGAEWFRTLAEAGYNVEFCGGPTLTPCFRMGLGKCPLRQRADVAVVEIQHPYEPPYGEWGEHACTKIPDDGKTIFISSPRGPIGPGYHLVHPVTNAAVRRAVERAAKASLRESVSASSVDE